MIPNHVKGPIYKNVFLLNDTFTEVVDGGFNI